MPSLKGYVRRWLWEGVDANLKSRSALGSLGFVYLIRVPLGLGSERLERPASRRTGFQPGWSSAQGRQAKSAGDGRSGKASARGAMAKKKKKRTRASAQNRRGLGERQDQSNSEVAPGATRRHRGRAASSRKADQATRAG